MTNDSSNHRLLLSAVEAAALLSIGKSLFWSLHSSGRLPLPIRLGRRTLWKKDELTAWTQANCPARSKWVAMNKGDKP